MIRVICIDDKNRPKEVAEKFWIKKGEQYTVEYIYRSLNPNSFDEIMVELKEVKMDESCKPYEFYNLKRFAIHKDDIEEFNYLCQVTAKDIEIETIIKETIENNI
jgi:hypothetical protein